LGNPQHGWYPILEGDRVTYITIGEFAKRTRLSPKALRLYGKLGLVVPARIDPDSGYRLYRDEQVKEARLVGLLRRLDMPLATIAEVLPLDGPDAAQAVAGWWAGVEAATNERRGLVDYLQVRLRGEDHPMYEIDIRSIPERTLLSINRHVDTFGTERFFRDAFASRAEHWFELEPVDGGTLLSHTVEGETPGEYEAVWAERIEPLHDRVLEALLDNVEAKVASDEPRAGGRSVDRRRMRGGSSVS
jgi:DNA-binding transcriptional MerR regulator